MTTKPRLRKLRQTCLASSPSSTCRSTTRRRRRGRIFNSASVRGLAVSERQPLHGVTVRPWTGPLHSQRGFIPSLGVGQRELFGRHALLWWADRLRPAVYGGSLATVLWRLGGRVGTAVNN